MEAKEILNRFKNGEITLEEAEHYFRKEPFEEMGDYAKLDSHREIRSRISGSDFFQWKSR